MCKFVYKKRAVKYVFVGLVLLGTPPYYILFYPSLDNSPILYIILP